MRYRVEVADRPDALYALSNGRIFRAQRSSTDGTILLTVGTDEPVPEDFDTRSQGSPAKIVQATETEATFAIHTYCLHDEEPFRIDPRSPAEELTLRWIGTDEQRAAELGLTALTRTTSDPESLTALWQERHDFAAERTANSNLGDNDVSALLRAIGRDLRGSLPSGWQHVAAQLRQVGNYAELEVRAVADGALVSLSAPPRLGQLFTQLRSAMYEPGTGTWFQGTFTLDAESNFHFDYNIDTEPRWRIPPEGRSTARSYDIELEHFPRQNIPPWLAAKAGLPLEVQFRQAQVVDGHQPGEKPVLNREPLPQHEVSSILGYLYGAPVIVNLPHHPLPDLFLSGRTQVPNAFHTDGTWIWSAAVPHYLRHYGVPPETELLEHIRAGKYRVPYVGERVRETAQAEVAGLPRPAQTVDDLLQTDSVGQVERNREPSEAPYASQLLHILHTRLAEYGVSESAYRIGTAHDGAWCLRYTPEGWEVAFHADGAPVEPRYFPRPTEAVEALLGALLLFPGRMHPKDEDIDNEAESVPADTAWDWAILPLRGEPPLHYYSGKRMITLPTGTTVQRFGNESGNLVHPETTRFPETSLTYEREFEQRFYRLRRSLHVLTGVLRSSGTLPGGGRAYLLPRAIGQHVESGALERQSWESPG